MFDRFDVSLWSPARLLTCGTLSLATIVAYASQFLGHKLPDPMSLREAVTALLCIYLAGSIFQSAAREMVEWEGDDLEMARADRINQLQRDISDAGYFQSSAESRGDAGNAAYWKGRILQLESELRRLGA